MKTRLSSVFSLLSLLLLTACGTDSPSNRVAVEGAELAYESIGEGHPVVVLHGGPGLGYAYMYGGLVSLSKAHRIVFYDQRGAGSSSGLEDEDLLTWEMYIQDLEGLLDTLEIEKCALLAHSYGSKLAVDFASKWPERVSHLVLMNAPFFSREDREEADAAIAARSVECGLAEDAMAAYDDPNASGEQLRKMYQAFFDLMLCDCEDTAELGLTPETSLSLARLQRRLLAKQEVDDRDQYPQLRELRMPTLVIHSTCDVLPRSVARRVADAVPDSELLMLTGAGHFPWLDIPDILVEELESFLSDAGKP